MILENGCNITKSEKFKGVWILSVPTVYIYIYIIQSLTTMLTYNGRCILKIVHFVKIGLEQHEGEEIMTHFWLRYPFTIIMGETCTTQQTAWTYQLNCSHVFLPPEELLEARSCSRKAVVEVHDHMDTRVDHGMEGAHSTCKKHYSKS